MTQTKLANELVERLACPTCGGKLEQVEDQQALSCPACQAVYRQEDGIWRMLSARQAERFRSFMDNYRPLRQAEGWERAEADYYMKLPWVAPGDAQAAIWRIRRRSFEQLKKVVGPGASLWALDLGAGNGWLSRRLAEQGFRVVALDLHTVGMDSLAGGIIYQEQTGVWFGRVQATMEELPFRAGSFNLVVSSGAFHYTDVEATLAEIWRVLVSDGQLIITDSPVYRDAKAGRQMAEEYRSRVRQTFGREAEWVGGPGFLVEREFRQALTALNFKLKLFSIERWPGYLKRRILRLVKPAQREEARFPVITAYKAHSASTVLMSGKGELSGKSSQ